VGHMLSKCKRNFEFGALDREKTLGGICM